MHCIHSAWPKDSLFWLQLADAKEVFTSTVPSGKGLITVKHLCEKPPRPHQLAVNPRLSLPRAACAAQVNYLSHWLMARKLVSEQLRRREAGEKGAATSTRVLFLTSFLHMAGRLDLNDLQLGRSAYTGFRGYSNSKLMDVLAAKQLQALFDRLVLTAARATAAMSAR